jgi:hypothetical protein
LSKGFVAVVLSVVLCGGSSLAYIFQQRVQASAELNRQIQLANAEAERVRQGIVVPTDQRVRAGENFAGALEKLGLTQQEAAAATSAAQQAFNLRQLRAGNTLTVGRSLEGRLREIDYRIDADRMLKIRPQEQGFSAMVAEIPSRTEIVAVRGTLGDSLFNAVEETGESAELAMRMAQIFGYDLDFYTDPRQGDTFCILLEKKRYANGQTAGYGRIFAAQYNNAGKNYQALLYHDPAGQPGYYTGDGKSLQKAFLRSPLKFGAAPSDPQDLSRAPGYGLRRACRNSRADHR